MKPISTIAIVLTIQAPFTTDLSQMKIPSLHSQTLPGVAATSTAPGPAIQTAPPIGERQQLLPDYDLNGRVVGQTASPPTSRPSSIHSKKKVRAKAIAMTGLAIFTTAVWIAILHL